MNAVGDVADRNLFFRLARIQVQSTWRARLPRAATKRRWPAAKASIPARSCRTLRRDCWDSRGPSAISRSCDRSQSVAQRTEMFLDQIRAEAVVAGGNRRVRGENDFARHARQPLRRSRSLLLPCGCGSLPARRIRCALRSDAERPA